MKKIIYILSFMICFTSFVNVSYAYTDISDNTTNFVVEELSSFSILNGYSDGTFKPQNPITRAEFSKMVCLSVMLENTMIADVLPFDDIENGYWAEEYIYILKTLGIVNGTSEVTFEPNANITYEQAIKMIVAALGYNELAINYGGYPNGYIKVANDLNILENIEFENSSLATRANIAKMLYNSMFVEFYNVFLSYDGNEVLYNLSEQNLYNLHTNRLSISETQENIEYEESKSDFDEEDSVG